VATADMSICELDQDILVTNVLSRVHPSDLRNFVLSCKTFYAQKCEYFEENEYTKGFQKYSKNTRDYFSAMANSYITFKRYNLSMQVMDIIKDRTNATTQLVQYHQSIGEKTEGAYRTYMLELLLNQYGYTAKTSCEQKMDLIFNTKWWKSNIDCYDMYQIVYHLSYRKYRSLQEHLRQLTPVYDSDCFHYGTFLSLIKTLSRISMSEQKLGLILKYVIFSYLGNIIDKISTRKYSGFFRECIDMIEVSEKCIDKAKYFPKYIRQLLSEKFSEIHSLLKDRL
jgi:hypothetical protein